MPRRSLLSAAEQATLLAMPESKEDLLRFYTFNESDMALIRRRRGDANRIGFAVQLAMLRYPGHALGTGARIPQAVIEWIGGQAGVAASAWARYGAREETRREHSQELRAYLGLSTFGLSDFRFLVRALTGPAAHTDDPLVLAGQAMAMLRQRGTIAPAMSVIDRACAEALARASRRTCTALVASLSERHRQLVDGLLQMRPDSNLTWLTWLRQSPPKPTARCMLEHIERLKTLRALGLPHGTGKVQQSRLQKLARAGAHIPAAGFAKFDSDRRYATLLAVLLERMATITDQIVELHERILVDLFTSAEIKYAAMEAVDAGDDCARGQSVPASFGQLRLVSRHFSTLRGYAPALLDVLALHARPAARDLLEAIEVLRSMNASNALKVPAHAPNTFIKPEWRPLLTGQAGIDRRLYEICALDELKNALRCGDIWVEGAQRFKNADARRLPVKKISVLQRASEPPLAAGAARERYLRDRLALLEHQLGNVRRYARSAGVLVHRKIQ